MRTALLCAVAAAALFHAADGEAAGGGLLDAARAGEREAALDLIKDGADPAEREADDTTALHWAVHNDDPVLVKRLLDAGADPNARNDYGVTPLAEAAVRGDDRIIALLLKAGADAESPTDYDQTALMAVARTGNLESARLLLEAGAAVDARETWRGQTALMWAAAQCQPAMIALLIEHGADPEARSTVNDWQRQISAERRAQWRPIGGLTPMLFAARQGCVDGARALVDGGADPDQTDPEGMTPMFMAANNFHFDVAAYLLEAGANPNKWDWRGRTPLYAAVDLNTVPRGGRPDRPSDDAVSSLDLIRRLLESGANPNIQLKLFPPYRYLKDDRGADNVLDRGTTPLLRAAKAFDAPAMALLLEHGALTELPTIHGVTPAMIAAGLGSTPIDTRGQFDTADVQQRSIAALTLLLEAGADINAEDALGQTPVFGAALWGWTDVVAFLADKGADLTHADNDGMTPLDAAQGKFSRGRGRGGLGGEAHPDTAQMIEDIIARQTAEGGPAEAARPLQADADRG